MRSFDRPLEEKKVIDFINEKLNINSHKGNSYQTCSLSTLLDKLNEEYGEVLIAWYKSRDYIQLKSELADVVNISSMILWRLKEV